MSLILQHQSAESIPISYFYFTYPLTHETKDVDHEYTGCYSRQNYKGFPRYQRRRINRTIIYSGEIT